MNISVMNMSSMKTSDSSPRRTLIADDQPDILEALRLLLKSEGFQIEAVTSPVEVIEALKQRDYDILLMDLNYARDTTSGQEGLDLLGHIQALDSTLPIVVMTAWGSIELTVEAMRRGVRDFVLKPWENARLLDILRTQIENGHTLRKKERLKAERKLLSSSIFDADDLKAMLQLVAEHLERALESRGIVIFTRGPREHSFAVTARCGVLDDSLYELRFEPDTDFLCALNAPLWAELAYLDKEEKREAAEADGVSEADNTLILPIKVKGKLTGFICIGSRLSNEPYDGDDMKFLDAVVGEVAIGVNNLLARGQQHELEEAREIQRGLLPRVIPQIPGYEISGAWRPAHLVSGDYFDVLKFDESRVAFCIADVSGKGMPAALLMSNVQAAVKAFASATAAPAELCEKVNRVVCSNTAEDKFITLFYCLLDAATGTLIYANAGHNAPILIRKDGASVQLEQGGTVLGPFPEWEFEQGEARLSSGDRVLLFTDGITEVRNTYGEEFGEERLNGLLIAKRELGAAELQKAVMSAVSEFSGGNFQDDATLIVLSVN